MGENIMKIRNGFVSNSSSSSFVLVFDKKINSIEDLKEVSGENFNNIYEKYNGEIIQYPKEHILDSIFNVLSDKEDLLLNLCSYYEDFYVNGFNEECPSYEQWMEHTEYKDSCITYGKKKLEKFKENFKDNFIYVLEYSDNDGTFDTFMEHYFEWEKIAKKVIKISHH